MTTTNKAKQSKPAKDLVSCSVFLDSSGSQFVLQENMLHWKFESRGPVSEQDCFQDVRRRQQ